MFYRTRRRIFTYASCNELAALRTELQHPMGRAAVGSVDDLLQLGLDPANYEADLAILFGSVVSRNHEEIALELINATTGRDRAAVLMGGVEWGALAFAAKYNMVKVMAAMLLVATKEQLSRGIQNMPPPVHTAVWYNSAECLQLLLEAAPDLAGMIYGGLMPLEIAAKQQSAAAMRLLLPLLDEASKVIPLRNLVAARQPQAVEVLLTTVAAADGPQHAALHAAVCIKFMSELPDEPLHDEKYSEVILLLLEAVLKQRDLAAAEWAALPEHLPGVERLLPLVMPDRPGEAGLVVRHMLPAVSARLRAGMLGLAHYCWPAEQHRRRQEGRRRGTGSSSSSEELHGPLPQAVITRILTLQSL